MSLFDTHQEDTDEEEEQVDHSNKEEQPEADDIAFIAKLKSSRTLASILKTIHFADVSLYHLYENKLMRFLFRMQYFVHYQLE
jgi:hypothetical protein